MSEMLILSPLLALALQVGAPTQDRPRRPPPEAVEACAERAAGDACGFTSPHGEVEGVCWRPDASKPLACRPQDASPPPQS